jgi:hypothetical protein
LNIKLINAVEALLFGAGRPLRISEIRSFLELSTQERIQIILLDNISRIICIRSWVDSSKKLLISDILNGRPAPNNKASTALINLIFNLTLQF